MKIKADFVTNSSSCSFMVLKTYLSETQIEFIFNHIEISMVISEDQSIELYNRPHDAWNIKDHGDKIECSTSMDNFSMDWFLIQIGVPEMAIVEYDHS